LPTRTIRPCLLTSSRVSARIPIRVRFFGKEVIKKGHLLPKEEHNTLKLDELGEHLIQLFYDWPRPTRGVRHHRVDQL
jgi:hypothetical protein